MLKRTITKDGHYQLVGLLTVGKQLLEQLTAVDKSMCALLGVKPDESGYSGHVCDTLYEVDERSPVHLSYELLGRLGMEVEPELSEPLQMLTSLPYVVRTDLPPPTSSVEEPPF